MYVMLYTWLDICFAICLVSRNQNNPGFAYWQTFKRIKFHLRGIVNLVLCDKGGDLKSRGYSNVDRVVTRMHVGQHHDLSSTWVGESCHGIVTMSIMEAYCVACYHRDKTHCH